MFDLVQLAFKIKLEPNQTNMIWVGAVFSRQYNFLFETLKSRQKVKTQHIFSMFPTKF